MHPRLLWDSIGVATAGVLEALFQRTPLQFTLDVRDVPGFGSGLMVLNLDADGINEAEVSRLRRTFEPSRQVELAAMAIAAFGLYHAGGHEIRDVALRGTGADYLVGDGSFLLEVAGRSRHSDFEPAWQQRWGRLKGHREREFFVCVAEFESLTGRLAFGPENG
jgi:hypothetical protein